MLLLVVGKRIQQGRTRWMEIVSKQQAEHHCLEDECGGGIGFGRFPTNQPRRALARHARKLA